MSDLDVTRLQRLVQCLVQQSDDLNREGDVDGAFRCVESARAIRDRIRATRWKGGFRVVS